MIGRFKTGMAFTDPDLYITRDADQRLYERICAGKWSYVFAPRQVGKSSLANAVVRRLKKETSIRAEVVELPVHDRDPAQDNKTSLERWYKALMRRIAESFELTKECVTHWNQLADLAPAEKLRSVIKTIILESGPVAILFDEVDRIQGLPFAADAFFAMLREAANSAEFDERWKRFRGALLGVVSIYELVRDPTQSILHLGDGEVQLLDFTRAELRQFNQELAQSDRDPERLLDEIFHWTNGHPLLTQELANAILNVEDSERKDVTVQQLVEKLYLHPTARSSGSEIILDIKKRFDPKIYAEQYDKIEPLLLLYLQVLRGEQILYESLNTIHQGVRVRGLVGLRRNGNNQSLVLGTRNRIFERVLDQTWVESVLAERPYAEKAHRWQQAGRAAENLLVGEALSAMQTWAAKQTAISALEQAFLNASIEQEAKYQVALAEAQKKHAEFEAIQATQEKRAQVIRSRVFFAVAVIALLAMVVSGVFLMRARNSERIARASTLLEQQAGQRAQQERDLRQGLQQLAFAAINARNPGNGISSIREALEALYNLGNRAADQPESILIRDTLLADGESIPLRECNGLSGPQAFSHDDTRVVLGCNDLKARIFDPRTGRLLQTLVGHTGRVSGAVFSHDSSQILTASDDLTARLWDAASGRLLRTPIEIHGSVDIAVFSHDSNQILTVSSDQKVQLWDSHSRSRLQIFNGHTERINSAVFSRDSSQVLTASDDHKARLWDSRTGKTIHILAEHTGSVSSAVFSHDSSQILTASIDGTARLWDAHSGQRLQTLLGHSGPVNSAVFSHDSSLILTVSDDRTARLWDAPSGRLLQILQGHTGMIYRGLFSYDSSQILTVSDDRTARLWDSPSGRLLQILYGHTDIIRRATFSHNSNLFLTASWDETTRLWRFPSGQLQQTLQERTGPLPDAVFSQNGSQVLTASSDRKARLWDARSGQLLQTYQGHDGIVNSAVFSHNGSQVLTASDDQTVRIWDTRSGQSLQTFRDHTGAVSNAVFSHDDSQILTASADQTARLWDARSGQLLQTFRGHTFVVTNAVFSHDESQVLTASQDQTARLWDAHSGRLQQTFWGHTGTVNSAVFSHDGGQILTASQDQTVRLWDAHSGRLQQTFRGHTGTVNSAVFSHDGGQILTASSDQTARIWHVSTRRLLQTLQGHTGALTTAVFSQDGSQILTASEDGTARLWLIDIHDLTALACARIRWQSEWDNSQRIRTLCTPLITENGDPILNHWTIRPQPAPNDTPPSTTRRF